MIAEGYIRLERIIQEMDKRYNEILKYLAEIIAHK